MKKKLLAILLTVVMVVSALAVLTACQDKEYTITFGSISGQEYFTLKTKDGKISKEAVEAETAKLSNGDMTFMGWYATLDYDQATDQTTYKDPIDYDKVYTEDTDYYAYWFGGSGSANGYTIVGVIGEETCWDEVPEDHDAWILQQDATKKWLYSVTLDVVGNNNFKVKEIAPGWNPEFGYEKLAEVTVADNAEITFPEGVTKDDLFASAGLGNIGVSASVETMNITVVYDHSIQKVRIIINSATILEEEPVYDYILVGTLKEGTWNPSSTDEAVMFKATEDENVFTLTYTFTKDNEWKVTLNNGAWSWSLGGSNLNPATAATDIVVTNNSTAEEIDKDDVVSKLFSGDDNISVLFDCTVTITIDVSASTIDIVVKAVTVIDLVQPEPNDSLWGLIGAAGWGDEDDIDLTYNEETGHHTLTYTFSEAVNFKFRTEHKWGTEVAWHGQNLSVVAGEGLSDSDIEGLFVDPQDGNIRVTGPCTVTFDLIYYSKSVWTLVITVTAVGEAA